jgi:hypothetical protein
MRDDAAAAHSTGRIETGRMQFESDWPGVFIRGDDALGFARSLRSVLKSAEDRIMKSVATEDELAQWSKIQDLAALLESCRADRASDD